jgi:hypothetical protein
MEDSTPERGKGGFSSICSLIESKSMGGHQRVKGLELVTPFLQRNNTQLQLFSWDSCVVVSGIVFLSYSYVFDYQMFLATIYVSSHA